MSEKQQTPRRRKSIFLMGGIASLAVVFLGVGGFAVREVIDRSDYFQITYWVVENLLPSTTVTEYYRDLGDQHSSELKNIVMNMTINETVKMLHAVDLWMPNFRAVKNGYPDKSVISKEQIDAMNERLLFFVKKGSPSLQNDITAELNRLNLSEFIGMTMAEAWLHLHKIWGMDNQMPLSEVIHPETRPTPTPFLTPTFIPYSIYAPKATLEGGEFARFWAEYRDKGDAYGFAYPADWILGIRSYGVSDEVKICNNYVDIICFNDPKGISVSIREELFFDPSLPLEKIAYELICGLGECAPITIIPAEADRPERAEVLVNRNDWIEYVIIYRIPDDKLIVFYTSAANMQTPEVKAIADSFVLGNYTPIRAPDFEPSKKM